MSGSIFSDLGMQKARRFGTVEVAAVQHAATRNDEEQNSTGSQSKKKKKKKKKKRQK
jgi:hypothetical protein